MLSFYFLCGIAMILKQVALWSKFLTGGSSELPMRFNDILGVFFWNLDV